MKIATRVTLGALFFAGCVGTVGDVGDFGPGPGGGGSPGTGPIGSAGGSTGTTGNAGSTGTQGTGGRAGTGGTTGGGSSTGLPCDIQALVQTRCVGCHAATPINGAPMPLVNLANLTAMSTANPAQTYAQRALARIQLTAGQMPPAPAARATPAEITALTSWIAAGSPAGTCGVVTGTGGSAGGTGGSAGAGGRSGAAGAPGTAGTVPCAVQTVYQAHCTTCHGTTLAGNAPMPLVTYANLTASSPIDSTATFAQRTVVRMQSTTSPMPPAPGTRATATEIQTVNSWIAAGYPTGTACNTGAGGGGGTGAPDPLGVAARCTSGTTWTGGNNGSAVMNPGLACVNCHRNQEEAPLFTIAGTLYPTGHEPNLCNGVNGTTGARVVIVDASNQTLTLTPNAAGNFTYTGTVRTPYTAKVTYQGRERIMPVAQTNGDCNSCHTQNGTSGAPGRITLP